jgi:hypothetical protein
MLKEFSSYSFDDTLELGYNEQIFRFQLVILLHKSTRL